MRSMYSSDKQMHNEHKLITQNEKSLWQVLLEISKFQGNLMQYFHATVNRVKTGCPKETEVMNRETVSRVVFILCSIWIHEGKSASRDSDTQYFMNWERWRELKNHELTNSQYKKEKVMKQYRDSLHNCSLCKNKWILWMIQRNSKKWNRITLEDCLTFPCQPEVIPSSSSILSRDKRLPLDTWNALGLQDNGFGNQFYIYIWFARKSFSRNSSWCCTWNARRDRTSSTSNRNRDLFRKRCRAEFRHNSIADICNKAVDHESITAGGYSSKFYGWTAKTANIGAALRQIPFTTFIFVGR